MIQETKQLLDKLDIFITQELLEKIVTVNPFYGKFCELSQNSAIEKGLISGPPPMIQELRPVRKALSIYLLCSQELINKYGKNVIDYVSDITEKKC